eukprot:TRINITY_DN778132_c0_g1_i1.p1 TRINITY_DN778132_c0_g1~~TRINITY_DN778132_c0_g1_i1.p1  ORF type:complete len:226 (-),score=69.10 TRINITY_DN778132_c0_g1_i1:178-855(-)
MSRPICSYIDHTVLKAVAKPEDIVKVCEEAKEYKFASVCINPTYVALAKEKLEGSDVKVCTVVGFPLGANTSAVKAFETEDAIKNGAEEIDMVIAVGMLKNGDYDYVKKDIEAVTEVCKKHNVLSKVIFETCLLTDEEKKKACELCVEAGANFVKTSTGFSTGGATKEDIKLMSDAVKEHGLGVKASGGVRSKDDADIVIANGATRIGASAGVKICQGLVAKSDY